MLSKSNGTEGASDNCSENLVDDSGSPGYNKLCPTISVEEMEAEVLHRQSPNPTLVELERRNRELFILHQIAEALNREVNLAEALQTALAQVAELFGLHTGWIFLQRQDSAEF